MSKPKNNNVEAIYPLTPLQEGMFYHKLLNEVGSEYIEQATWRMEQPLLIPQFEESLALLARKHNVLRTRIVTPKSSDVPWQVIVKEQKTECVIKDYTNVTKEEEDEISKREAKRDIDRGFDFAKDGLFRVTILNFGNNRAKVIWTFHHILMDGWCMSILINDFALFYEELTEGVDKKVIEQRIDQELLGVSTYGDYVNWLRKKDRTKGLQYFKHLLADYTEIANIKPSKIKEVAAITKTYQLPFSKEVTDRAIEKSKKWNVTLNSVMECAWGVLLQKYNRVDDVVFGKVVSGRNADLIGMERMIGLFINTIPVRVQSEEGMTFGQLVKQVQEEAIQSEEYSYCSLAEIQAQTSIGRELIQTLFVYENYYVEENKAENTKMKFVFESGREATNYALTLTVVCKDVLECTMMYDAALYTEKEIEAILKRLQFVVEQVVSADDVSIASLETVLQEEQQRILVDFNRTQAEYPREKTIVQLFEEQVEKTPERVALIYKEEKVTYRKLNEMANQLARKLREYQVKPNDRIAIVAERSIEMIVGIYGILKAGGAYVPVDPIYPRDRIEYILSDCNPALVLTYNVDVTCTATQIDLADSQIWEGDTYNLNLVNKPEDLLYVIYTSGTTGRPKGVQLEHRNLVRLMVNDKNLYDFCESDVWMMFHSFCFDFSVWEMYGATLYGGALVLLPKEVVKDANLVLDTIKKNQVTVLNQVPSSFYQLMKEDKGSFASVRYLIFGGEALNPRYLEGFKKQYPSIKIINMYGITETTVHVTYREIGEAEIERGISDIGTAIPTLQVYIMEKDQLCGIGIPGELCVAGDGLARGYLNREELTKEKFVKNPFGDGRLYRSGDLARWLPDGTIEYLGRIDKQVKIRGFRIELGEIESEISNMEGIENVAVLVREDHKKEKAIYAYLVSSTLNLDMDSIRSMLRKRLPEYMIPTYMCQIDEIPVNHNGKRNLAALPDIQLVKESDYVAPRNELEETLVKIYETILMVHPIGINDNFFTLGGHSLTVTRLVNQIAAETGERISLKEVFEHPTVCELAICIENAKHKKEYSPIPLTEKQAYYPMSSAQKRMYLIHQMDDTGVAYNMPTVIPLAEPIERDQLYAIAKTLMERHEILRTSFHMVEGEPVQKIHEEMEPWIEYIESDGRTKEEKISKMKSFVRPFKLEMAPLMRIGYMEGYLLLDMHHIISDGVTMSILIKEFNDLYHGKQLEERNAQYKDYSAWSSTRDLSAQKAYWLDTFKGEIPVLDLPYDYKRPVEQSFEGDTVELSLSPELTQQVKAFASETTTTEYMVYLSALMILLSKYSRQEDIIIGSPVAGRTHKDTEQMLGMFVNTLALRGRPVRTMTCLDFLQEMKQTCLKGFENQDYPFEELVDEIDVARDMSRNPLFDVMFSLQTQGNEELVVAAGEEEIRILDHITKFDLTFQLSIRDSICTISLDYRVDLFQREHMSYLLKHYEEVIQTLCANPNQLIGEVDGLNAEERELIVHRWNETEMEYEKEQTIPILLKQQVEANPNQIALILSEKEITYQEFYHRVNGIAHQLRNCKVAANDLVVILAKRSFELIEGIYGIMQAGGAYVPMDITYPKERIRYMMEDCKPKAVVIYDIGEELEAYVREIINPSCAVIDLKEKSIFEAETVVEPMNQPSDLAYIIYTSGTSGKPKGVMIEHRGVVNLRTHLLKTYHVSKEDRVLQFANTVFDASVWEMTLSLLTGATLVLVSGEQIADTAVFSKYVEEKKVTLTLLPPQYYAMTKIANLRILTTGGSAASAELIKEALTNYSYINAYGPTETTVLATQWDTADKNEIPYNIPIGRPLTNMKAFVLNQNTLCGVGIPGELCVTGDGLARGYLNQEELTKQKFVPAPLESAQRMYRTGDLVRWNSQGLLEYLGRIDNQIKIRGYRVELGEIEQVLREHSAITDVAVIVRKDKSEDQIICAYYVACKQTDAKELEQELKQRLKQNLPDYMIPGYLMQLEQLPLNQSGKLDVKALPELTMSQKEAFVAPATKWEIEIAEMFGETLGIEQVGANDNFFELGGHSLKATKVVNHMSEYYHKAIPLKALFLHPTVKELARWLEENLEHKSTFEVITKAEKKDTYEMSSAQKRLFLINQIEDTKTAFNIPMALKVHGMIDVKQLEEVVNQLVNRHEILRTSFHMEQGNPVQRMVDSVSLSVEEMHLASCSKEEQMERLKAFVRPFDIGKAPLVRVGVAYLGEKESVLLLDMHHMISDGGTMSLLIREVNALMNHETLPPLEVQYKDYSEWMKTRDLSEQEEYWCQEFYEEPPIINLPYDFKRPQHKKVDGSIQSFELDGDIKAKIKAFADKTGTTEYMVFLSAYMIMLSKYCRQDDVVVGSPVSGRVNKATESMFGMFVNMLAMRGRPQADKTIEAFLTEVKETTLKAFENQEYPFEELVEKVDITRDLSRNPFFDVMFVFQNNDQVALNLGGYQTEALLLDTNNAKYDITLDIEPKENGYQVLIEYRSDLFLSKSITYMFDHFRMVLEHMMADSTKTIGELSMVSKQEKAVLLHEFNDTYVPYDRTLTVIDVLEEQVRKNPDHIAVVFENQKITYSEINQRMNQVAHKLRSLGVKPNDYVAIMTKRCIERIIGIYGIIKAGGAYVPMELNTPRERVDYMISDCNAKALLYCGEGDSDTENFSIPVIDLERLDTEALETENLPIVNRAQDVMYVIYTSGTTGKPKGVMVEHRGVINLVETYTRKLGITKDSHVMHFTNYIFDGSVWEFNMALLNGATLYIPNKEERENPHEFARYFEKHHITVAALPPAFYNIIEDVAPDIIITAGEESTPEIVERAVKTGIYVNAYGPTEATVSASCWIGDKHSKIPERIPIGKPLDNYAIYILNGLELCGVGIPGELCIAGDGVARGYIHREELTREKFISNPFGEGKLYRTGDLARFTTEGMIEFLGRVDEQVKIRGFRIELSEIEMVLKQQPYIIDSTVIARNDANGEKAVYAYYIADQEIPVAVVKEDLAKVLPEYMIPMYLMQIDEIPITANGKVDKKALPEIALVREVSYLPPQTQTEECIASIYQEVLGMERIGRNDNFFQLGGHSLRATRVINEIAKRTGKQIPLKKIFEYPVVEQLAKVVDEIEESTDQSIPKAKEATEYPMSSAQKRLFMIQEIDDPKTTYNMPAVIPLEGEVDISRLEAAYQALIERHDILRTSFHMKDGVQIQKIHKEVDAHIEILDLSNVTEEARRNRMNEFVKPFDLSVAPLMRMALVHREQASDLLLFDMHHIISDGRTKNILIQEFNTLYKGESLTPLTVQYKDYSEWMNTRDLSSQREYWLQEFKEEIPVLDLPLDHVRPQIQLFDGDTVHRKVDASIKAKLEKLTGRSNTTEYMVFLSALMVLLSKYSRQEDIVVGTTVSGRTNKDTEDMIGMFVNTLALRGRPEKNKSYEEFLAEVKETSLKAFENQEYPFEELIRDLNVTRDMSRNPIFDVMFVFQNNEEAKLEVLADQEESETIGKTMAKFDLTFVVEYGKDGYELAIEYRKDLFRRKSIEFMLSHFVQLMTNIVETPEKAIFDLEMITKEEIEHIQSNWNKTKACYPTQKTVVDLFEQQVNKTPNNIALIYETETMTYKELNERANRLANHLVHLGVGIEDYVALVMDRSMDMIVGIYAVIKAGAAYVPIDPSYPKERIEYTLEDCKPKAILINQKEQQTFDYAEAEIVPVSEIDLEKESASNLSVPIQPDHLLYVIYTSGTTGRPKGVQITHRNLVRLLVNDQFQFDFHDKDVWMMFHSYCFDFSVWEMYGATLTGAKLVVLPKQVAQDSEQVVRVIQKNKVTILNQVPSAFYNLMRADQGQLSSVRYLIFGGEALNPARLIEWKAQYRALKVINMYGITETTVHVTYQEIGQKEMEAGISNIGSAIPTLKVYIMNEMQLCGIGVPGELCVVGEGLARGYLNREELTNEKFVMNPATNERIYRSGDLARWLPDGTLEYLSRIDQQVKIRGFRIELGEIENAIRKVPDVENVAVIVREQNKEKAICAYVVSKNKTLTMSTIRENIRKRLPEYMVPGYMMQIDEIPVTSNGKLDRKALPMIQVVSEAEYVEPKTELEQMVCQVCKEVLQIEKVGLHDNFFELGGDSLRSIQVVRKIREQGYELKVKDLMLSQNFTDIVSLLEQKERNIRVTYKVTDIGVIDGTHKFDEKPYEELLEAYEANLQERKIVRTYQAMKYQEVFWREEPDNICPVMIEVSGQITEEHLKDALQSLIMEQAVLRSVYTKDNQIQEYDGEHWFIPCVRKEDFEWFDNDWRLMCGRREYFREERLQAKIAMVRMEENLYHVHFNVQHCLWDEMSTEILVDRLKHHLGLVDGGEMMESYADFVERKLTSDCEVKENEFIEQFISSAKEHAEFYDKMGGRQYSVVVRKAITEQEQYEFAKNPFAALMKVYVKAYQVDKEMSHIPFAVLYHGRTWKNQKTLGMHLDLIPAIYDIASETVIGGFDLITDTSVELAEQGSVFDHYYEQIGAYRDKVLGINYGGIFGFGDEIEFKKQIKIVKTDFFAIMGVAKESMIHMLLPAYEKEEEEIMKRFETILKS